LRRLALLLLPVVLTALLAPTVAAAGQIEGVWAVEQLERKVERDCHEHTGSHCVGWDVWHCYKVGRGQKVRCKAIEELEHDGNWRECRFHALAVKEPGSAYVNFWFMPFGCFNHRGERVGNH